VGGKEGGIVLVDAAAGTLVQAIDKVHWQLKRGPLGALLGAAGLGGGGGGIAGMILLLVTRVLGRACCGSIDNAAGRPSTPDLGCSQMVKATQSHTHIHTHAGIGGGAGHNTAARVAARTGVGGPPPHNAVGAPVTEVVCVEGGMLSGGADGVVRYHPLAALTTPHAADQAPLFTMTKT
jgi:hypothetical protein